jgi:hypothetical protein
LHSFYLFPHRSLIDRAIWRMRPRDSIPLSGAAARYDFSSYDNQFRIVTELIFYQGVADHPCLAHFFPPPFCVFHALFRLLQKYFSWSPPYLICFHHLKSGLMA